MKPTLELLESRCAPSCPVPTADESAFLALLNAARADPAAYGRVAGLDLAHVPPRPPLRVDTRLLDAARGHAQDMNGRRYFDHWNPDGQGAGERIHAAGLPADDWGESLAAGFAGHAAALDGLIHSKGHREHLLGVGGSDDHDAIGVGYVVGDGPYRTYWTINTAVATTPDPCTRAPWLRRLYADLLGRIPADGELALWEGVGDAQVVRAFLSSPEYLGLQVDRWYRMHLGREPDPAGRGHWLAALRAGHSGEAVEQAILASPEYRGPAVDFFGPEHSRARAAALYRNLLHREPDAGGLGYFAMLLAGGARETDLVTAFVASDEYRTAA